MTSLLHQTERKNTRKTFRRRLQTSSSTATQKQKANGTNRHMQQINTQICMRRMVSDELNLTQERLTAAENAHEDTIEDKNRTTRELETDKSRMKCIFFTTHSFFHFPTLKQQAKKGATPSKRPSSTKRPLSQWIRPSNYRYLLALQPLRPLKIRTRSMLGSDLCISS